MLYYRHYIILNKEISKESNAKMCYDVTNTGSHKSLGGIANLLEPSE
jgi:hypothetical protein